MTSNELYYLTIAEASAGLRRKDYSPVDLTEACLERIAALDGKLHSFITITAERARTAVRALRGNGVTFMPTPGARVPRRAKRNKNSHRAKGADRCMAFQSRSKIST